MGVFAGFLRTPAAAGVLFCAALLALGGCAAPPQLAALQRDWPGALPDRVTLSEVPFFAQEDHLCGPASLAMVAQAAGSLVTPEALTPLVYLPGRQGALQVEMLAATRRQGLVPVLVAPQLGSVLAEVAAGSPVLILQNLGLSFAERWHYAVVMGYDRARQEVVMHSGTTAAMRMPLNTFEHTWARSGHWAVRVASPDKIPPTATPQTWARAAASLENVAPSAAWVAWASAQARWPGDRASLLGLGNAAYRLGRLDAAGAAFEHAVKAHPDFADAWNNLAQVRSEQRRWAEAKLAIDRAMAFGGQRQAGYETLRRLIDAQMR